MNQKQSNFYEVLDAIQGNAKVGVGGVFKITTKIKVANQCLKVSLDVEGLNVTETTNSTFAIMRVGDIGLIFKAHKSRLEYIYVLNLQHKDMVAYLKTEDYAALLQHLSELVDKDWLLETIKC